MKRFLNKKSLIIMGILLYCLAIILPPIIYGQIYPNESDDTASSIAFMTQMFEGKTQLFDQNYFGYIIVGYPLYYLAKLLHVSFNIVFMWFNVVLPLIMSAVLYFVFSRLVNKLAGYFALVIPVLVSGASIYCIYQGIIFNLINVTILYPLLIYFVVKWFTEHRVYQLICMLVLSVIVSVFHISGLYLPVIVVFATVIYVAYGLINKKKIFDKYLFIIIGIVVIGICGIMLLPGVRQQVIDVIKYIHGDIVFKSDIYIKGTIYKTLISTPYYVTYFVSIFVLVMFGIAIWKFKDIKSNLSNKSKLFIYIMSCWGVVLLVTTYAKLSTIPYRQQIDFAIVFAMLTTALVGILAKTNKLILVACCILICVGLYPQFIPHWFENNSAIKEADKQTIEYVNSFGYNTYNCSPTVSQHIYDVYLHAQYSSDSSILIMRNIPQTQGSDEQSIYYNGRGTNSTEGYTLDKTFYDGTVEIKVYRK